MTMEERLENLERKMRRGRQLNLCLSAALCVCLGVWAFSGGWWKGEAAADKEIRARNFVLEDENGKIHAMLAVVEDGPALALCDERGEPRAWLGVAKNGPSLALSDETGETRAWLAVLNDGPGLELLDERGQSRAGLTVLKNEPALMLYDEMGKAIWKAP